MRYRSKAAAVLLALATALGFSVATAPAASAYSIRVVAKYAQYWDHGGNAATGRVYTEAYIIEAVNGFGDVVGTKARCRLYDVSGGVDAIEIRRCAMGTVAEYPSGGRLIGEDTLVPNHKSTPDGATGSLVNTFPNWEFWVDAKGFEPDSSLPLFGLIVDMDFAVRWGDGQLGVYDTGSLDSFWYSCPNNYGAWGPAYCSAFDLGQSA